MGFFVKIEFDLWMISYTIDTFKFQIDCALCCGDTALCLRSRHTPNNREITVQRRCYVRVWHFRILHVNWKSIKWLWVGPFKMNVKIEQGSDFVTDNGHQLFFNAQEGKKRTVVQ